MKQNPEGRLEKANARCQQILQKALGDLDCQESQSLLYLSRFGREAMSNLLWLRENCANFTASEKWPISKCDLSQLPVIDDTGCLQIGEHQVMHRWQTPLMHRMVKSVCVAEGDILEIGFGLGIASEEIQKSNVKSHTIIEAHPTVFETMVNWARSKAENNLTLLKGAWRELLPELGEYDSLFFDPYPFNDVEFRQYWLDDITFSAHFFPFAAQLLRPGGRFTYYSNEVDSMSREHQRQLLRYFSRIETCLVKDLQPPEGCQYWWAPTMLVITAVK